MPQRQSHYFDSDPDTGHDYAMVRASWEQLAFQFQTDSGVFSRHRLDPGTDLLVKTVLGVFPDRPSRVLDLGTGVGVAAIALARLRPRVTVIASDVNRRALQLAAGNIARAGLDKRVTLVECDGVPDGVYDLILTNPPIRAGKEVVYRLFRESARALSPDGSLYVVIRVKQGAASARRELENYFGKVETLARSKGYHVLRASEAAAGLMKRGDKR
ncbi:MAG TPA: methyltransferase [Bacillota bacterium]|jgi:16S rRNA (guanine1207-N2)-methyltransferase|nr:methyltransferase [Fastidiosipila sp.]HPX93125.1 methyltransferase [Bacillota bacterium]HQB81368.1 methyltransferase [Bacillota bacterium]